MSKSKLGKRKKTVEFLASTAAPPPKRQDTKDNNMVEVVAANGNSLPPAGSSLSVADQLDDFEDLKAWIAQREAAAQPPPLTEAQRRALADLKAAIATPEPEAGEKDWVSLVFRYRDAHQLTGDTVSFPESPGPGGKWLCHCILSSAMWSEPKTFPGPERGLKVIDRVGTLGSPGFARKKDAKQYAAKCCIEWLMSNSYMPSDGENVTFVKMKQPRPSAPPLHAPSRKPTVASDSSSSSSSTDNGGFLDPSHSLPNKPSDNTREDTPEVDNIDVPPPTYSLPPKPPPQAVDTDDTTNDTRSLPKQATTTTTTTTTTTPSGSIDVHDDNIPATQRVIEMCKRLGIKAPGYPLVPSSTDQNCFFSGGPDFGEDGYMVPHHIGRITNCYGRKFAREKIAEDVLVYLFKIEDERMKTAEAALADLLPPE
ncbi:hypothetical protein B0T19DRAFT_399106 [Cercophora scortea]|uniref:DRBM domain-containing protein n=1 Tax=Cercophora scortea TaxID=314031 RepID=A0AAE0MI28_9PEZI|nr:hypothetical protein B0T19DRAFT_399106 [Cercophora scortea]